MKAKIKLLNVGEMEAELAITMTVREWGYVKKALSPSNDPAFAVYDAIRALIERAESGYEEVTEVTR